MRRLRLRTGVAAAGAVALAACAQPGPAMRWPDLLARPRPRADATLAYGALPQQAGDLWLPHRPHAPLVVMVHGGCWTKSVADRSIMDWAAADLRGRGVAVWNVEYRGVDEPGGGYPGTYADVAAAVDAARRIARDHDLDFSRPVILGHSAGGHLALWAAARPRLPAASPLHAADPVRFAAVVDLAGIADLARDRGTACGPGPVEAMAGPIGPDRPDPFADTSPAALAPLGVLTVVLHGSADVTVRPEIGAAYAALARARGDAVEVLTPPGNHVEEIAPGTPAFEAAAGAVLRALAGGPGPVRRERPS